MRNSKTGTDWKRVFSESDADAPIAFIPDDDDPCDPNDDEAMRATWTRYNSTDLESQ